MAILKKVANITKELFMEKGQEYALKPSIFRMPAMRKVLNQV